MEPPSVARALEMVDELAVWYESMDKSEEELKGSSAGTGGIGVGICSGDELGSGDGRIVRMEERGEGMEDAALGWRMTVVL